MRAIERTQVFNPERKEERVVIIATTTPATLPKTGVNVDNMPDDAYVSCGSVLLALDTSKKYVANEAGTFVEWAG